MAHRRLESVVAFVLVAGLPFCAHAAPKSKTKSAAAADTQPLTSRERALQALNRLTFGLRPGDLQAVESMGVDKWINLQLHPDRIPDSQLQSLLTSLPAMQLSESQLLAKFPPPNVLRRQDRAGVERMPSDPVEQAIYRNVLADAEMNAKAAKDLYYTAQPATAATSTTAAPTSAAPQMQTDEMSAAKIPAPDDSPYAAQISQLLAMSPNARYQAVLALAPGEPRKLLQHMNGNQKQRLVAGLMPQQREVVTALAAPTLLITDEVSSQKLLYDIYSQRQLLEVITSFWLNHFNVYMRKNGVAPWQIATYERDVIRPNALGSFEKLLDAVAQSPAMMTYLDNATSIGPDSIAAQNQRRTPNAQGKPPADRGLNENYARELMELHTLGVNGGYTQQDVIAVAKVFTGWTVDPPLQGGNFTYNERRHEPGTKVVLGHSMAQAGQEEGFWVLHILATSPATAHFISHKLAVAFVSDNPPPALVNRMAATFLKSHGDIRSVLRTMLSSPEFWSRSAYRAKVKTPYEFLVSAVRATNADAPNPQALIRTAQQLGQPMYGMQTPNGYPQTADAWVNSDALLARMNVALSLTANRINGVHVDLPTLDAAAPGGDPEQSEAALESALLNGEVSAHTHTAVLQQMAQTDVAPTAPAAEIPAAMPVARAAKPHPGTPQDQTAAAAAGLLLGSPDFQRR